MSNLRIATQQALEALEESEQYYGSDSALRDAIQILRAALEQPEPFQPDWDRIEPLQEALREHMAEIHRLRAALEQPEQEPVAWQWLNTAHFRKKLPADAEPGAWNPLYTHPPRREWRGLTEEEIRDLWSWSATVEAERTATTQQHAFARAIEAALKERNA